MSKGNILGGASARASQLALVALQVIQQQIAALRRLYADARAARRPMVPAPWCTA